jgi:hypothetical protein
VVMGAAWAAGHSDEHGRSSGGRKEGAHLHLIGYSGPG